MVIKKKSNNNWEYCIYLGLDEKGKKKYKRKSGFKTKKECMLEAQKYKKVDPKCSYLFIDVCNDFLDMSKNKGLRPTTIISYTKIIKNIIEKFEMSYKDINTITSNDIYNFIDKYTQFHANNSKRKIIEIFKYIFSYAKKNQIIKDNIFDDIPFPKILPTIKNIWTEAEIKEYIPILKKCKYYDVIYLALETGLRRGEILALTWDCVDLARGTLLINKSYVYITGYNGIVPPKTTAGHREIALLNESLNILKRRYENKTSKYVFPSSKNNDIPVNPHTISSHFKKFLIKNNIKPIRFHDLRHIHATLLLNKDINHKIVSKRLGHTNVSFTLQTYTHITSDYETKLFKNLSSIF